MFPLSCGFAAFSARGATVDQRRRRSTPTYVRRARRAVRDGAPAAYAAHGSERPFKHGSASRPRGRPSSLACRSPRFHTRFGSLLASSADEPEAQPSVRGAFHPQSPTHGRARSAGPPAPAPARETSRRRWHSGRTARAGVGPLPLRGSAVAAPPRFQARRGRPGPAMPTPGVTRMDGAAFDLRSFGPEEPARPRRHLRQADIIAADFLLRGPRPLLRVLCTERAGGRG